MAARWRVTDDAHRRGGPALGQPDLRRAGRRHAAQPPREPALRRCRPTPSCGPAGAGSTRPRASANCRWRTASTRSSRPSGPTTSSSAWSTPSPTRISARVEAYYKDYEELKPRFENLFDPLVVLPELQTDRVEVAADRRAGPRPRVPRPGSLRRALGLVAELRLVPGRGNRRGGGRPPELGPAPHLQRRHQLDRGSLGRWRSPAPGTAGWPTTPATYAPASRSRWSRSAPATPRTSTTSAPWTCGPATPSSWVTPSC